MAGDGKNIGAEVLPEGPLLTSDEFGAHLRMHPRTAVRKARSGEIEAYFVAGKWLFPLRAAHHALQAGRGEDVADAG